MKNKELLDINQVAVLLGVSVSSIRHYLYHEIYTNNRIPCYKRKGNWVSINDDLIPVDESLNGRLVFVKEEVLEWLNN